MSEEVPQWAIERARVLAGLEAVTPFWAHAFARYIAAHEKPPVDPDVLAVREILAAIDGTALTARKTLDGVNDDLDEFQAALAAFRKHKEAGK